MAPAAEWNVPRTPNLYDKRHTLNPSHKLQAMVLEPRLRWGQNLFNSKLNTDKAAKWIYGENPQKEKGKKKYSLSFNEKSEQLCGWKMKYNDNVFYAQ